MENSFRKIMLDDIASYSGWPARLLGLDPFEIKQKNASEVIREFGDEKWGHLLKLFSGRPTFDLVDVEAMEKDPKKIIPCFDKKLGFYLIESKQADGQVIKYFQETLSYYANDASCIVELGAGYGAKIFNLSNSPKIKDLEVFAAEYTQSGCDLMNLISKTINKNIKVGQCDFNTLSITGIKIPKNAIIFTSYAVHYVPELTNKFVEFIYRIKPKAVVHFEPCYEYFDDRTVHGLMCKRYVELNGYTRNIASSIEAGCKQVGAKIKIQKNVHGSNPFLPFSIIEWEPEY